MLVIGRKRDEKLIIDGDIEITVLKVGRNHVKFGINAPSHVRIHTRAGTAVGEAPVEPAAKVREVAMPLEETAPKPKSESRSAEVRAADGSD